MTLSQAVVVTWCQFMLGSAFLLFSARVVINRLVQPSDRQRSIEFSLAAVILLPLLMTLAPWPALRLGLIAPDGSNPAARTPAESTNETGGFKTIETTSNQSGTKTFEVPSDRSSRSDHSDSTVSDSGPSADPALTNRLSISDSGLPIRDSLNLWPVAACGIIAAHSLVLFYSLFELGMGHLWLRRLLLKSTLSTEVVDRAWDAATHADGGHVRLRVSSSIDAPLMFGWIRPVVLIPQDIAASGGEKLRFCLAHEWAHIQCGDLLVWRCVWVCQSLLFFQPAYWALQEGNSALPGHAGRRPRNTRGRRCRRIRRLARQLRTKANVGLRQRFTDVSRPTRALGASSPTPVAASSSASP